MRRSIFHGSNSSRDGQRPVSPLDAFHAFLVPFQRNGVTARWRHNRLSNQKLVCELAILAKYSWAATASNIEEYEMKCNVPIMNISTSGIIVYNGWNTGVAWEIPSDLQLKRCGVWSEDISLGEFPAYRHCKGTRFALTPNLQRYPESTRIMHSIWKYLTNLHSNTLMANQGSTIPGLLH